MTGIEGTPAPAGAADAAADAAAGPVADAAADFTIVGGNPSAVEVAAVTAVLASAVEELDAEKPLEEDSGQSAWQLSQRGIRSPLHPAKGAWRGFSG